MIDKDELEVDFEKLYKETLETVERDIIKRCLVVCNKNKLQAAKKLGIDRKTLYNRMRKLNML